jgi:hypothetical protein
MKPKPKERASVGECLIVIKPHTDAAVGARDKVYSGCHSYRWNVERIGIE